MREVDSALLVILLAHSLDYWHAPHHLLSVGCFQYEAKGDRDAVDRSSAEVPVLKLLLKASDILVVDARDPHFAKVGDEVILYGAAVPLTFISTEPMPPPSLLPRPFTFCIKEVFREGFEGAALFRDNLAVIEVALRPGRGFLERILTRTLALAVDEHVRALCGTPSAIIFTELNVEHLAAVRWSCVKGEVVAFYSRAHVFISFFLNFRIMRE